MSLYKIEDLSWESVVNVACLKMGESEIEHLEAQVKRLKEQVDYLERQLRGLTEKRGHYMAQSDVEELEWQGPE